MRVAGPATRGFLRVKESEYFAGRVGCGSEILLRGGCGYATTPEISRKIV